MTDSKTKGTDQMKIEVTTEDYETAMRELCRERSDLFGNDVIDARAIEVAKRRAGKAEA